ncbi:hypothetical protein [Amycolatopsis anabasis]|uniref:hypothetical protein n=1 Tax=Amycolatopsis anabasis TaxID=1840409 RepID=UPI00131E4F9E|nr:hypothetical protein [Amycolatopsis anabasis]
MCEPAGIAIGIDTAGSRGVQRDRRGGGVHLGAPVRSGPDGRRIILAAVAAPVADADARPFGVSLVTRAFEDQVALDVAVLLTGEKKKTLIPQRESTSWCSAGTCAASPAAR